MPQGSPLFIILFLFYNIELFEIYQRSSSKVLGVGFADNLNVLAYSTLIARHYKKLEELYRDYIAQAYCFSIKFKLIKYKLIYFLIATRRFNLLALVHLNSIIKALFKEIKVLSIYLDLKLKQAAYTKHFKTKIVI